MPSSPLIHIIVLNYNDAQITLDCVRSVLKIDYPNLKVVVVDNASADGSALVLAKEIGAINDPRIELLLNERNEGYTGGNNRGIEKALAAGAEYIFVLNNDTIAEPGCLRPLIEAMERDASIGIASCPIFNTRRECPADIGYRISLYTGKQALWSNGEMPKETTEVHSICGAAMLLRAAIIPRVGMFDERFFLLCEDLEISFRARKAGFKACFVPGPGVRHLESYTTSRYRPVLIYCGIRNRAWFIRRYGNLAQRLVFNVLSFGYSYPRAVFGRVVRREFQLLLPVLKGIRDGHWGYPGASTGPSAHPGIGEQGIVERVHR
jgi:hypothetical protein